MKNLFLKLLFCILFLSFSQISNAQLTLVMSEQGIEKSIHCSSDSDCIHKALSIQKKAIAMGYLLYSLDSIYKIDLVWNVKFYKGNMYQEIQYSNTSNHSEIFKKKFNNKGITFNTKTANLIEYFSNNGYPFVEIKSDSTIVQGEIIKSKIHINKHYEVIIDKIENTNLSFKLSEKFVEDIVGIKQNSIYNQKEIRNIEKRIQLHPYLSLNGAPQVNFRDSFCYIKLHLEEKKISNANGLIGVLPNSNSTGDLLITADVKLDLQNLFNRGVSLGVNWQKLQPYSQKIDFTFSYPYLFHTSWSFQSTFRLQKQDTSFVNVDWKIGSSSISDLNLFQVYFQNKSTIVLNKDTSFVYTKKLPTVLDVSHYSGGVQWTINKLNNFQAPTQGFVLDIGVALGIKIIHPSSEVTKRTDMYGKSLSYLYDAVQTTSQLYQTVLNADLYLPISKTFVNKLSLKSKAILTKNISINEMLRIGGNKILRGFDEESILSPFYNVLSEEYRMNIANSYVFLFGDLGMVQDSRVDLFKIEIPFGFGLGFQLVTKSGNFGITYALGKRYENPINFASSKIHFGYITQF